MIGYPGCSVPIYPQLYANDIYKVVSLGSTLKYLQQNLVFDGMHFFLKSLLSHAKVLDDQIVGGGQMQDGMQ